MTDPGEGPGGPNWGAKGRKNNFSQAWPFPLSQGLNDRPPPPLYLEVWIRHCLHFSTVSMYNTSAWFVLEDPTMKVVGPSIWNCLCPSSLYSCWNENSISKLSINQYYVFPTSEGTTRQEFNQTSTDFSTKQLPRQLRNVQFPYSTGVPLSIHSGNGKETKWMSDLTYIPLTLSVYF